MDEEENHDLGSSSSMDVIEPSLVDPEAPYDVQDRDVNKESLEVEQPSVDTDSKPGLILEDEVAVDSEFMPDTEIPAVTPVIIVAPGHECKTQFDSDLMQTGSIEPPQKKIKLEQMKVDGKTFYLTLEDDAMAAAISRAQAGSDKQVVSVASSSIAKNIQSTETRLDITQAWFTTRDEKNTLHQKGYEWRQGQWSAEEIKILENNIQQYCHSHGVNDATEIIFMMSKDERKDFYRTVAKGLRRPLFSVYRRITRMYDQKNHVGKYSDEEIAKLKELKEKHGTDWASIGAALGRSASSVKDRWRLMKETCNSGKWSEREELLLAEAVYALSGAKPGESVTSGLSWAQVAEKVGTRSEKQCRTKWLNYLNWKQKGGTEWTRQDDVLLLEKLSACGAATDSDIDWEKLAKGWPSARSPQWLRGKWWTLKRNDPQYQTKPLPEVLKYCQDIVKPTKVTNKTNQILSKPCPTVAQDAILQLSVPSSSGEPVVTVQDDSGKLVKEAGNNFQTYEVLQTIPTATTKGTFLIAQPDNTVSVAQSGIVTDQIILQTMPINQVEVNVNGEIAGNVMVQVNPQVIISSNNDIISSSPAIVQSQEELSVGEVPCDEEQENQTVHAVDVNHVMSDETMIAASVAYKDQETIVNDNKEEHAGISIVHVVASEPLQFVHTAGSETELLPMATLVDPMLAHETTERPEFIGTISDSDVDKVHSDEHDGAK